MKEYLKKLVKKDIAEIQNNINKINNRYGGAAATNQQDLLERIQLEEEKIATAANYLNKLNQIDFENL